jgi:EAL domain-containing protein (putative c-di-GMP-specific phosphodiesterase class I)
MSFFKKFLARKTQTISEDELLLALKNHEFVFYYQPEWDLKTGKPLGLEALMRWESPKRGIVPPMDFIPLLEHSKLIGNFSQFLFEQTFADLKKIHEVSPNLFMAVNLSLLQIQEPGFVELVKSIADAQQIDMKHLECEITETQGLTQDVIESGTLDKLAALNVTISMDDFGSGYSSLAHLRKLKIQKLKIDLDFTKTLMEDPKNQTIVDAIIQLGHDLGFPVLAEGIETTEQQEWLKEHGCDYGQGYWFSRALPLDQLLSFLKTHQ